MEGDSGHGSRHTNGCIREEKPGSRPGRPSLDIQTLNLYKMRMAESIRAERVSRFGSTAT